MTEFPAPKQVGPEKELTLTGMLMPWKDGQPALLHMLGTEASVYYLPLFEDPDQLRAVLARADVPFESIKQVEDGGEFLDSVPPDIVVVVNPRFTDEGKVRFFQVQR